MRTRNLGFLSRNKFTVMNKPVVVPHVHVFRQVKKGTFPLEMFTEGKNK